MGLSIKDIIPRKEMDIQSLKGKTVCVDAFNTLYQFLTTIRQADGTPLMDDNQNITSHLSGIFYRNISLLLEGVKLIYVFDGKAPMLKTKTHAKRGFVRELAQEKYDVAKQDEDLEAMRKYSSQLVRLNSEMIEESKELLEAMGIMVVQAPSEGESEAAFLAKKESIYASVSQDYDSLLFGAPKLIRNLTLARRKKVFGNWVEVHPEIIELEDVLKKLEINLDQLICIGILVGSDYNPRGVPGIGQKRALQIVKEHKEPALIFESVRENIEKLDEEDQFDWKEIFELFKNPELSDEKIEFKKFDENKIIEILVKRHNFSKDRIEKQVQKLKDLEEKSKQKGLNQWF